MPVYAGSTEDLVKAFENENRGGIIKALNNGADVNARDEMG